MQKLGGVGIRRPTLTLVARTLRAAGFITYQHLPHDNPAAHPLFRWI